MKNLISKMFLAIGISVAASTGHAAGDPAKGEALSGVCAACHGADGNSPAPNFPKLAGLGQKYLLKQLKDIKSGARVIPEMTGLLDNLSEEDMANIAAHYDSKGLQLAGAKEFKVKTNNSEEVSALELGEKTYRAGNVETQVPACTGCHSPTGRGNEPAGYPRLSGQHAQYIEKQLRDFRAGNRSNDTDAKIMRKVAEHLSDAEILALANYIAGLN
jgi:cytochrome c553